MKTFAALSLMGSLVISSISAHAFEDCMERIHRGHPNSYQFSEVYSCELSKELKGKSDYSSACFSIHKISQYGGIDLQIAVNRHNQTSEYGQTNLVPAFNIDLEKPVIGVTSMGGGRSIGDKKTQTEIKLNREKSTLEIKYSEKGLTGMKLKLHVLFDCQEISL